MGRGRDADDFVMENGERFLEIGRERNSFDQFSVTEDIEMYSKRDAFLIPATGVLSFEEVFLKNI